MLSGHGCFGAYLYRIRKKPNPDCWYGCAEADSAEHTLASCGNFVAQRTRLLATLGLRGQTTPEAIVEKSMEGAPAWEAFTVYYREVLLAKEALERVKEREALALGHTGPGGN